MRYGRGVWAQEHRQEGVGPYGVRGFRSPERLRMGIWPAAAPNGSGESNHFIKKMLAQKSHGDPGEESQKTPPIYFLKEK